MLSLLESENDLNCEKCVSFIPHDTFEYMGLCDKRTELVISGKQTSMCENFKEVTLEELKKTLEEKGWLYCVSCKEALYTLEELEEHHRDILAASAYADIVASEESPTG